MSLLLYMSEFEDPFTDFAKEQPALHFENITYGDWKAHREAELVIDIPESVQNNASFYGHFYLVAKPHEDGKGMKDFVAKEPLKVLHTKKLLTRFFAPAKPKAAKKLLMSDQQESEEGGASDSIPEGPLPITSHWAPNLTLTILSDVVAVQANPLVDPYMVVHERQYFPIVYPNDFWVLKEGQIQLNSTTKQVPLRVTYDPISFLKFNMYESMSASWEKDKDKPQNPLAGPTIEPDEIKKLLLTANPYWAAATAILSVLHMMCVVASHPLRLCCIDVI